jgi:hypothetical protein
MLTADFPVQNAAWAAAYASVTSPATDPPPARGYPGCPAVQNKNTGARHRHRPGPQRSQEFVEKKMGGKKMNSFSFPTFSFPISSIIPALDETGWVVSNEMTVDQLPPEIARQIHPDCRKNEAEYWAVREQLLDEYQGKWIGFADGRVVASGTSFVTVFHAAEATGLRPFFICVGKEEQPCRIRRANFAYDIRECFWFCATPQNITPPVRRLFVGT